MESITPLTPAEEINHLRNENARLRMDLASLRPQLLKARQQRHEIHDQLRSARHRIAELERLLL